MDYNIKTGDWVVLKSLAALEKSDKDLGRAMIGHTFIRDIWKSTFFVTRVRTLRSNQQVAELGLTVDGDYLFDGNAVLLSALKPAFLHAPLLHIKDLYGT